MNKQKNDLRPLLCICFLSAMLMAAQALSPGIGELRRLYGVSEADAMLLVTLPYLLSIPMSLVTGLWVTRRAKKTLAVLSGLVVAATGIAPWFLTGFPVVLCLRAVMGLGLGVLFTLAPSLAPDYYGPGPLRDLAIGMQSAWAGSGGFVFNILSGYLVQTQPRNIYLVYLICLALTLAVLVLLPFRPPVGGSRTRQRIRLSGSSLLICLMTVLFLAAGMTLTLNAAALLEERGLGGSVEAGFATSCYSAAAFCVGLLYALISRVLKGKMPIFAACGVSLAGMLLWAIGGGLVPMYLGAVLVGTGLSLFMPGCIGLIIATTPAEQASMSIAVMMVGSAIGQTFSGDLMALAGTGTSGRFFLSAAIFAAVALLALLLNTGKKKEAA